MLNALALETAKDVLSMLAQELLGMKPCLYLVEINIFSLNHVIVRITKIMNNFLKHLKILTFKIIFLCQKLVKYFPEKFSYKNIGLDDHFLPKNVFEKFDFQNTFFS